MRRATAGLVLATILLGACSDGSSGGAQPAPSPTFRKGTAIIETDAGAVMVEIEVADSPALHARGLMHRESLPDDAGMLFLFFQDGEGSFYMKDTLIPLSIAFFDRDGVILKIMDMEPCEEGRCPSYLPGVTYRGALEVNQGAFEEWGVEVGDRIRVSP